MPDAKTIAISALILNILNMNILIARGIITRAQAREELDKVLLVLEEFIPLLGGDGQAVHGMLSAVLSAFDEAGFPK